MENSLKRLLLLLAFPLFVCAHVEDPHVTAGKATFEKPDANTQLIHAADKTVINCKTFNVGKDETVHFIQIHPKDRVLCRVTGKEASLIEGHLEADGRLFLINPNSIFFRETAQVNVHSLIASTLDIKDEDFVKGNYRFFLDKDAKNSAVTNKGQISAAQDVVFMASQLINRAVVKAKAGRIAFLGGELITLNFEGDNLISFVIDGPLKTGFIEQAGRVESGQEVLLKLRVADEAIKNVVNTSGIEPATSMQIENGKIYLVAGSSIAAPKVKIESPLVQTIGDFAGTEKIELTTDKELKWQGGHINSKLNSTDVALNVSNGLLTIDAPLGKNKDDKVTIKNLTLNGKTIDQNAPIKTYGSITYSAEKILLGGDIAVSNKPITFNGPVIIDADRVEIANGFGAGNIMFNGTLNADQSSRSLTISNGKEFGTISFNGTIGSTGSLKQLTVTTGNLSLSNIGDNTHAGVGLLNVKAQNADIFGTIIHAKEQKWGDSESRNTVNIALKGGDLTKLITQESPLTFIPNTHIFLSSATNVSFETHGGNLELSKLSGDDRQSITIQTGHGNVKIGEFSGKLGLLHVQGQNIEYNGKVDVGSIFMEAQEKICYAKSEEKTFQYELISEGEVTLNAKRGEVGTREFPILVKSNGKLFVGAKSYAYIEGSCEGGFYDIYKKNPPPWVVFNGKETQFVFNEEIFMEEQELLSLAPDLYHIIPHGFVDAKHFINRRAPIYYVK